MDVDLLANWCAQQGLDLTEMPHKKGRHWHLRKPGCSGTLEVTTLEGRTEVTVRRNRQGSWTEATAAELRSQLGGDQ